MSVVRAATSIPGPKSKALIDRWKNVEAQSTGYQAAIVRHFSSSVSVMHSSHVKKCPDEGEVFQYAEPCAGAIHKIAAPLSLA